MDDIRVPIKANSPRFLDRFRWFMRQQQLALTTEKTYLHWVRGYIRYHNRKHPQQMGAAEVDAYLSWLAIERQCAPATQAQALNALVFLYKRFLNVDPVTGELLGRSDISTTEIYTHVLNKGGRGVVSPID